MAGSLVCYTVESGSDSDEEMDIKPELETVQHTPTEVVNTILVELLDSVFTGTRDFSDMYIKEEPIDPDDIKEEFDQDYRDGIKVEIDSDDCESDSDDSSDCSSVIAEIPDIKQEVVKEGPPRTKNELRLCDLPPVEDLDVQVSESEVKKMGRISSWVEELVVIESCAGIPAIDVDSVLFLDNGQRALGRVFDVFGPVSQPYYSVRFNSDKHIQEKGLERGMDVFYAPKSEYTSFIFLEQLMRLKISDASWKDDEEPPPQFLDYSDDEEERKAKQTRTIEKMVEGGATEEEVQRKKAKFSGAAARGRGRGRGATYQPRYQENAQDGNLSYNNQRHDNGLYDRTMNPFYRQGRNFNPRDMGPIRWNSYRPGGNQEPGYGNQEPRYGNQESGYGQEGYSSNSGYFSQPRPSGSDHRQSQYYEPEPGYSQNHDNSYHRGPNHNQSQQIYNQSQYQGWSNPPPPPPY